MWTSNYEIGISILWVHTMCCDTVNYFCQKCPILSFWERLVYFFASSILSKMLNFVIFWEDYGFLILPFCQKCSILSFYERTVNFFASSILSKMLNFVIFWETLIFFSLFQFCHFVKEESVFFFSLFQFCQKWSILSYLKSGLQIMR